MTPFVEAPPLRVAGLAPQGKGDFFAAHEAAVVEAAILATLEGLPPGGLLPIDFDGVRVSSEAARQMLARGIRRTMSGELLDRFLVLWKLGSSRYNAQVMLESEGLVAVERAAEGQGAALIGRFEAAVNETYQFVLTRPSATAGDVKEGLGLESTAAATNRLIRLTKLALARRVGERPISGGGREYIYAAVH